MVFLSLFKHGCEFKGKNYRIRWSSSEIELNRRVSTIYLEVRCRRFGVEKKSERLPEELTQSWSFASGAGSQQG